ncbi:MAG TPA: phosphoserine phosphatase SerB, partial [Paracoccus sp. (in: a-proteobacteria)]|nr:phosphoserine phosphatase SerB [Paracoccus sp. (in: a-proteobacteria)]
MFTISILAAPARADLDDDTVSGLKRRWQGGHALWLDPGTAAEFPVAERPADFDAASDELDARGIDLAIQPSANRRKAVLLADMDSTMIQQECIDELA